MCGIAALIDPDRSDLAGRIGRMTDQLSHRGPDDVGVAVLNSAGVALGMRRLSIVDLAGGHQPMWSEDRATVVVFNGEIYNAPDLRVQLERAGHKFATDHSDTEVVVHGYEEWGRGLFPRLDGMFAIALWDAREKALVVARDRTGEKPLYIGRLPNGGYVIGSELKSLLCDDRLSRELDPDALEQYFAFDYSLSPRTVIRAVSKLPAAHFAAIKPSGYTPTRYWIPDTTHEGGLTEADALDQLDEHLTRAIRTRLIADVPVGVFLSGGVDSSTVAYYAAREVSGLRSFCVGFADERFDESDYARRVAHGLGTEHLEEILSIDLLRDLVPRVPEVIDEPMADSSILPTLFVSQFARRHVKVALGGDGSDELFMGYKAYQPLKVAWMLDALPPGVRRGIAVTARGLPAHAGQRGLRGVQFARKLDSAPVDRFLAHLGSWKGEARGVLSAECRAGITGRLFDDARATLLRGTNLATAADETIVAYLRAYLQEDILAKVDRASMAASLELRSPFLAPELIDFALQLPNELKMRRLNRKYLLRKLMRGRLPDEVLDRPKRGFSIPVAPWLRGPLAPLVAEHLSPERVREMQVLDPTQVQRTVDDHLSGARDNGSRLWVLLAFAMWHDRWIAGGGTAAPPTAGVLQA